VVISFVCFVKYSACPYFSKQTSDAGIYFNPLFKAISEDFGLFFFDKINVKYSACPYFFLQKTPLWNLKERSSFMNFD